MRTLWPRWTLLPAAPFVLWCSYCLFVRREWRWEILAILIAAPALAYGSLKTKRLFTGLFPLLMVGLLYDGMRFFQDVGVSVSSVHLCGLRELEVTLFGARPGGVSMTAHDWLQAHSSLVADAYFAIPYGTYLFVAIGYAAYLGFVDHEALKRYGWTWLALNVAGFLTYHLYPAAPPWYFHQHGCVVDLAATASEGPNLARVDAWLGFSYFHSLYGRSHDVFGAVPSLHVTYPVLILMVGWARHRWPARVLMIVYAVSMIVGAVYLDHHWVIDVVVGLLFVLAAYPLTVAALARIGALAQLAQNPAGVVPAFRTSALDAAHRPSA